MSITWVVISTSLYVYSTTITRVIEHYFSGVTIIQYRRQLNSHDLPFGHISLLNVILTVLIKWGSVLSALNHQDCIAFSSSTTSSPAWTCKIRRLAEAHTTEKTLCDQSFEVNFTSKLGTSSCHRYMKICQKSTQEKENLSVPDLTGSFFLVQGRTEVCILAEKI